MKIAALQMQAIAGNPDANLARIDRAAGEAAGAGARLLIAPELAVTGYGAGEAFAALAEPANGPLADRLGAMARAHGLTIVAGFAERDGTKIYNSAMLTNGIDPPVIYRKSHLYGAYERQWFRPGSPATVTATVDGLTVGMLICYDVEFPENVRRLALAGVDLVVVPTALPEGASGRFIADHMIAVRAFENQVFVAYVNHCAADARFAYAGLSRIAAPDGAILADASETGEALIFAEIAPDAYAESRRDNTYLADLDPPV